MARPCMTPDRPDVGKQTAPVIPPADAGSVATCQTACLAYGGNPEPRTWTALNLPPSKRIQFTTGQFRAPWDLPYTQ